VSAQHQQNITFENLKKCCFYRLEVNLFKKQFVSNNNLKNYNMQKENVNNTTNKKTCKCTQENMQPKLKILAIHGYRQNAETFKQKTGSFRKMMHKWAQFTYITAPHKVILIDDMNQVNNIDIGQSKDEGKIYSPIVKCGH
jgi:hypothetical protein